MLSTTKVLKDILEMLNEYRQTTPLERNWQDEVLGLGTKATYDHHYLQAKKWVRRAASDHMLDDPELESVPN